MNSCVLCLCLAAGVSGQAPSVVPGVPVQGPDVAPPPMVYPPMIAPPALIQVPAPISPGQFAQAFQPAPGKYQVTFIHPDTCCPVVVCFDLPCAPCPPRVYCGRRTLTFDYGRHKVVIRFRLIGGGTHVRYT